MTSSFIFLVVLDSLGPSFDGTKLVTEECEVEGCDDSGGFEEEGRSCGGSFLIEVGGGTGFEVEGGTCGGSFLIEERG